MTRSSSAFLLLSVSLLLSSTAVEARTHATPLTSLTSNQITGLMHVGDTLWVSTVKGVNYTADTGLTWKGFTQTHGLGTDTAGAMIAAYGRVLIATFGQNGNDYYGTGVAHYDPASESWSNTTFTWKNNSSRKLGYAAAAGDSLILFAYVYGGLLINDLRSDSGWFVRLPDTTGRLPAYPMRDFPPDSLWIRDSVEYGGQMYPETTFPGRYVVWSVAVDSSGPGPCRFYAGTSDGLYRSADRCASWSRIALPPGAGREVLGLWTQDLGGSTALWAAAENNRDTTIAQTPKLLRSTDGGASWTQADSLDGGLPSTMAFAGTAAWAVNGNGFYRLQGTSIARTPSYFQGRGLTPRTCNTISVEMKQGDTIVWVGTDEGLFHSATAGAGWGNPIQICPPVSTGLRQIYAVPNVLDFRTDGVRFVYNLRQSGRTTIEVFDWNMDRVKTIIRDQVRTAGNETPNKRSASYLEDRWDGTNERGDRVSIGTYYFRIKTDKGEKGFGKILVAR